MSIGKQAQRTARILALLPFLVFSAQPALAVQVHGGIEGLVSHQIGHVLFAGGMLFLLVTSYRSRWSGPGWDRFKCFLRLTIVWNILTFSGHWLQIGLADDKFVRAGGKIVGFRIDSFRDGFFYLASLDHLVLLPALLCLSVALRQWVKAGEGGR